MQYNSKSRKLTLTVYEQATLERARGILADAGRILDSKALREAACSVAVGIAVLTMGKIEDDVPA